MNKLTTLALVAILSLTSLADVSRDLSIAVEDAARTALSSLAADARVKDVKSIAFVKLRFPQGKKDLSLDSNSSQVFEATLASKAESFSFVTHDTHTEEWKLIDGIFDQAADFESYDPKTHPELKKLKLADALLIGQVIDVAADKKKDKTETSVRIAMRLLKISTGEQIWGSVITGKHVEVAEARDIQKELVDDAKGLLTTRNIMYAIGGLIGLIILFILIGKMTRVR